MKKSMITLVLIILASFVPGVLAVRQYYEAKESERLSDIAKDSLNVKIDKLNASNDELKEQLAILLKDNLELSRQLTKTALKLNDNVVGSGTLDVDLAIMAVNNFCFNFKNNTDLPVNNVHIHIYDYAELRKCEVLNETDDYVSFDSKCLIGSVQVINGITLNPKSGISTIDQIRSFTSDFMKYAILIQTRKEKQWYFCVYKIVGGELKKSYRVYDLIDNKFHFKSEFNQLSLPSNYWKDNFYIKEIKIKN